MVYIDKVRDRKSEERKIVYNMPEDPVLVVNMVKYIQNVYFFFTTGIIKLKWGGENTCPSRGTDDTCTNTVGWK